MKTEPDIMSLELLRRARNIGFKGEKTAFFVLVKSLRRKNKSFIMRFEGHDVRHCAHYYLNLTQWT